MNINKEVVALTIIDYTKKRLAEYLTNDNDGINPVLGPANELCDDINRVLSDFDMEDLHNIFKSIRKEYIKSTDKNMSETDAEINKLSYSLLENEYLNLVTYNIINIAGKKANVIETTQMINAEIIGCIAKCKENCDENIIDYLTNEKNRATQSIIQDSNKNVYDAHKKHLLDACNEALNIYHSYFEAKEQGLTAD